MATRKSKTTLKRPTKSPQQSTLSIPTNEELDELNLLFEGEESLSDWRNEFTEEDSY